MLRHSRPAQLLALLSGLALIAVSACRPSAPGDEATRQGGPKAMTPSPAAGSVSSHSTLALQPLKIQVPTKSTVFTSLYVTKALGIFEQHGFDAEIITMSPPVAAAALQANELDFMAAIGSAARAALRGLPIRIVYVESTGPDHVLLGAKELTSVSQLRGKVVAAYTPANNVNAMIVELLRLNGLAPGTYELLNVGDGAARAAALATGQVAATLLDSSDALPLQREGYPVLDRVAGKLGILFVGLAANTVALQTRRDHLRQALRAAVAGIELTHTQRDLVLPLMAKEFDLSLEDASEIYRGLQLGWTADGKPEPAVLQFEFEMDQRELGLSEPIRPEQVLDFSLLDEIRGGR